MLGGGDVERRGQVDDDAVDVAVLQRLDLRRSCRRRPTARRSGCTTSWMYFRLLVPTWAPELERLQVGDARRRGSGCPVHRDDGLLDGVVAVAEVDRLLALGRDRDLVDVEVEVLGAGRVGAVERHDDPLHLLLGEAEVLRQRVGHGGLEALAVGRVVVHEVRRVGRAVGARSSACPGVRSGRFARLQSSALPVGVAAVVGASSVPQAVRARRATPATARAVRAGRRSDMGGPSRRTALAAEAYPAVSPGRRPNPGS